MDSERTPVPKMMLPQSQSPPSNETNTPTTHKKPVYTRKKSTSAMQQRKISAELGIKQHQQQQIEIGEVAATDSSGSVAAGTGAPNKISTNNMFLSPSRPAASTEPTSRSHYHRHHHNHHSHQHHTSNSSSLRKHVLVRRSPSPSMSPGYEQYQMQLLEVPWPRGDYGDASSDDLSSEWDSDAPDSRPSGFFGGFKVKGEAYRCLVFSKRN